MARLEAKGLKQVYKMKKIVLLTALVLMLLVALPLVSAASKVYSAKTNTITIKNWLGQDVVSLRLIDNTDQCLQNCHATIKIHAYKDIDLGRHTNIIFNFYNRKFRKALGNELESWDVLYKGKESYEVNVNDYGTCEGSRINNETGLNETYTYRCVTGSHKETRQREVWKPFKASLRSATLKAGKDYYVRLEGKKRIGSSVEWIPNIYGYDLKEWAWWDSSCLLYTSPSPRDS